MKLHKFIVPANGRYYLLIAVAGIIGFLPVSFMLFALKNDIIALDYPIKYFISQCLQNNVQPFWFNTWAKGFPLESIITWSFFSPLQFLTASLFNYNLYTLHAEFLFYILVAGAGMFSFLKEHVSPQKDFCVIMAVSYMLSGFSVGSSQWMTYITALALLPIVVHCFIGFLKKPSFRTSILLVAVYYLMLTSVYPAFTIIISYSLATFFLVHLFNKWKSDKPYFSRTKLWTVLAFTFFLMVVTYSTSLFFSLQVLSSIDRGNPIEAQTGFFYSNYLHPKALLSLLLPFSSTKIQLANTEGTMMDCYTGLLPVLLLPLSIVQNLRERNKTSLTLFIVTAGFLVISFGHLTPLRESLNILPGFSYFRNPGLFRLFFIFSFLVYLTYTFRSAFVPILFTEKKYRRTGVLTIVSIGGFFVVMTLANFGGLMQLASGAVSVKEAFYDLAYTHTLVISAVVQLGLLLLLVVVYRRKNYRLSGYIAIADVIINCLICTPFFTVSSYSVKETNATILESVRGFPVQTTNTSDVATSFRIGNAIWPNTNVYKKQVSERESSVGPLKLIPASHAGLQTDTTLRGKPLLFAVDQQARVILLVQQPNYISASIEAVKPTDIVLQQNYYPAWHAYWNGEGINIVPLQGAMKVTVPKGGKLVFKYERTLLFGWIIILNSLVLGVLLYFVVSRLMTGQFEKEKVH